MLTSGVYMTTHRETTGLIDCLIVYTLTLHCESQACGFDEAASAEAAIGGVYETARGGFGSA